MKKQCLKLSVLLGTLSLSCTAVAEIKLGHPEHVLGEISASTTWRAQYQNKTFGEPTTDQKVEFN